MRIVKYEARHLDTLILQEGQAYLSEWLTAEHKRALEAKTAFTALDGEHVLIVAGILPLWQRRVIAWAYLDREAGRHMIAIHKAVTRFLDLQRGVRVEATVDADFEAGHRWVRLLGFQLEAPRMRAYRPDGGDSALYARVN